MKKALKITGIVLTVLVLAVAGVVSYVKFALPDVGPPPDLKVELTPERVKHGEYLTRSVLVCLHCHSGTDANLFTAPVTPGKEGSGGEVFPPDYIKELHDAITRPEQYTINFDFLRRKVLRAMAR